MGYIHLNPLRARIVVKFKDLAKYPYSGHSVLVGKVQNEFVDEIWKPGNQPLRVRARSLTCFWAVREWGMSGTSVGKLLGLGQPAVSRAVVQGEKIFREMNIQLIN